MQLLHSLEATASRWEQSSLGHPVLASPGLRILDTTKQTAALGVIARAQTIQRLDDITLSSRAWHHSRELSCMRTALRLFKAGGAKPQCPSPPTVFACPSL
jgi:hypothetical protein